MNTDACVNNSFPDQLWWRWQSDWMIGACASEAGIPATRQPAERFNQFACTSELVQFCANVDVAEFDTPATLHPVRLYAQMKHLYAFYENSTFNEVPRVRMRRVPVSGSGSQVDDLDRQRGHGVFNLDGPSYADLSGLELSR